MKISMELRVCAPYSYHQNIVIMNTLAVEQFNTSKIVGNNDMLESAIFKWMPYHGVARVNWELEAFKVPEFTRTGIFEIPGTICTLYNLQILLLSRCDKLMLLPSNIGSFNYYLTVLNCWKGLMAVSTTVLRTILI
ncbi:hypothetical protein FNV43_RR19701 [Rhamnella rubrinervis]|uniref:Uncharacterized protein n=1 Tax=Rhamnella rubrinervis TaxID=2594499 RepID=A0A8K0GTY0_9ROSA|nr:hypothetical protein FNV43_RR19701 [Rhamnella rubrinervis]